MWSINFNILLVKSFTSQFYRHFTFVLSLFNGQIHQELVSQCWFYLLHFLCLKFNLKSQLHTFLLLSKGGIVYQQDLFLSLILDMMAKYSFCFKHNSKGYLVALCKWHPTFIKFIFTSFYFLAIHYATIFQFCSTHPT